MPSISIGPISISRTSFLGALQWVSSARSGYVVFCNVHSFVTALDVPLFASAVNGAGLSLPDGFPIARLLRRSGAREQTRISGPDFMCEYMRLAASRGEAVFFYGSSADTLDNLVARMQTLYPGLRCHSYSPPFRPLSSEEEMEVLERITNSGARTVWVSLGCPKQEIWMARVAPMTPAVLLGVGAAFDFLAGSKRRAPEWMRKSGLEWLHRLWSEPGRLWRRYAYTNLRFVIHCALGALKSR